MRPLLLAACAASAFGVAMAQQATVSAASSATDSAMAAASLPQVSVAGTRALYTAVTPAAAKLDAPNRDIPQTINVVPEQLIKDQAAHSMQDVLKSVPGVGLNGGDGQRDQVTIRGFTAMADQFLDGVRDDVMIYRDLSNIAQVEVVKGPASVLYGRGSSGGLINRVTKKPQWASFTEMAMIGGSFSQQRLEADGNRMLDDNTAVRLTGALERSGGFRDQYLLEREAIAPSLLLRATPSTTVLLQYEHLRDLRVTDFGIPSYQGKPVAMPISTYYGSSDARANDTTRARIDYGTLTIEHELSDTLFVHDVLRSYDYALDRNNTVSDTVNLTSAVPMVEMRRGNVRRSEKGWFNQAELKQQLHSGATRHQLLYGVELGDQTKDQFFSSRSNVFSTPLFAPVLQRPPAFIATPSTDGVGRFKVASAYVQDLVGISPHWKALAGLRWDRFVQTYDNQLPAGTPLARTDRFVSPRLGAVFQPDAVQAYYASITRSFQPSGESTGLASNNAELAPEQTTNAELGAKFDLAGGKLTAGVSVFRLTRTDIKTTDPSNPAKLVLAGEQRTDGVELTLAGDLGQGWTVYAGYAYLDALITKSNSTIAVPIKTVPAQAPMPLQGKVPGSVPRHAGSVWATKSLGGGFSAAGGLNARGAMFASNTNAVVLDAFVTMDLALFYRVRPWDLALNLKNAADRRYFVSAVNDNDSNPGAPRSLELSARYRF